MRNRPGMLSVGSVLVGFLLGVCGALVLMYALFVHKKHEKKLKNNQGSDPSSINDLIVQKDKTIQLLFDLLATSSTKHVKKNLSTINGISENSTNNANIASQELSNLTALMQDQQQSVASIHQITQSSYALVESGSNSISTVQNALSQFQQSEQSLQGIDSKLMEISDKSDEIEHIGKEAEMLALNAAIESARAGDAGRGFAVVADNMKLLAKNSQVTSREIREILQDNRKEINKITDGINMQSDKLSSNIETLFDVFNKVTDAVQTIQKNAGDFKSEIDQSTDLAKSITESTKTTMETMVQELAQLASNISGVKIKHLSPSEVHNQISGFDEIIDVRREDEFNDALGHIPQAKLVTLQTQLRSQIKEFDASKKYLFVCRSGGRSTKAAQMAIANGIEHVFNLDGGMLKWREANF